MYIWLFLKSDYIYNQKWQEEFLSSEHDCLNHRTCPRFYLRVRRKKTDREKKRESNNLGLNSEFISSVNQSCFKTSLSLIWVTWGGIYCIILYFLGCTWPHSLVYSRHYLFYINNILINPDIWVTSEDLYFDWKNSS